VLKKIVSPSGGSPAGFAVDREMPELIFRPPEAKFRRGGLPGFSAMGDPKSTALRGFWLEAPAAPPAPSKEEVLLTEIRDALRSR
jgi:hypothetical protein